MGGKALISVCDASVFVMVFLWFSLKSLAAAVANSRILFCAVNKSQVFGIFRFESSDLDFNGSRLLSYMCVR